MWNKLEKIEPLFSDTLPQDSLRSLFLKTGNTKAATMCLIHEAWQSAVGPQLSVHMQPIKLINDTLLVSVDSPIWAQELHYIKETILERLNNLSTHIHINDIRTTI